MHEEQGRVSCPECERHLSRRLLYQLIEFHVHGPVAEKDDS
ncbi:hypothetical protein [Streptomyces sp. NPDC002573]